jgi:3-deoxy-D-manno-octulosonic-acid transferase
MPNLYDLAYGAAVAVAAPYWLIKPSARRKTLKALRQRDARDVPDWSTADRPALLIHAVSVGEVNSTPALVAELRRRRPGVRFLITTTTETGFERSRQLYRDDPDVALARFPLDFTVRVDRLLDRVRPAAVVLMELEVWPNFMRQCGRRGIPVMVANGRVTLPALRRYRFGGPVTRAMFARLAAAGVQDPTYADRFAQLGVPRDRIAIVGTMKFDSATIADRIEGDDALAAAVGIQPGDLVWVCGSTGPGEERMVLEAYRALLGEHPSLRLVIVPRHPPRFDEVAEIIRGAGFALLRRSAPKPEGERPVILGDTMGELRMFYSLASVVFVGRSLVDLGPRQAGSDMIEPAALGRPVIVGPHTGNFDMPMRLFRSAGAVVEIATESDLRDAVGRLLGDPDQRRTLGRRAQQVVRDAQGATAQLADLILRLSGPARAR